MWSSNEIYWSYTRLSTYYHSFDIRLAIDKVSYKFNLSNRTPFRKISNIPSKCDVETLDETKWLYICSELKRELKNVDETKLYSTFWSLNVTSWRLVAPPSSFIKGGFTCQFRLLLKELTLGFFEWIKSAIIMIRKPQSPLLSKKYLMSHC